MNKQSNTVETDTPPMLTDSTRLVIDAITLNDINTIYGVPGIPIAAEYAHSIPKAWFPI